MAVSEGEGPRERERCGDGGPGPVAALARAAAGARSAGDPFAVIARELKAVLAVPDCLVCAWDDPGETLTCRAGDGRDGQGPASDPALPPSVVRLAAAAIDRGEPVQDGVRLCVPFGVERPADGCIVVADPGRERFSADEVALVVIFGDLAALAVHRERSAGRRAEQAEHLRSLLNAGRSITSSLVVQDVLDALAREVVETLGSDYCVIWEYLPDDDALLERAGYGRVDGFSVDGEVIACAERPYEREILFSEGPVLETLSDPALHPDSRESMERWGEKTCLSLPLRFGSEAIGVLVVCEASRERTFSDEELALAEGLATQASAAVHNARIYRDLERRSEESVDRARRERLLGELSLEMSASLDRRTVLDVAAGRCCAILEASSCSINLLADPWLDCVAGYRDGDLLADVSGLRALLSERPASVLAVEGRSSVVVDSRDDPRLGAAERGLLSEFEYGSLLVTPMLVRGRVMGTLEVAWRRRPGAISTEEVATAEACARVVALAADNATLHQAQVDHARRLASLLHAGRAITSSLVIDDVLAALVRTAATSLDSPEALIYEYDAEADTLAMRSIYTEVSVYYEDLDRPFPIADYPSDRVALESRDVIVETISDPALPADVRESMTLHDEKTCLTVPLRYGAEALGMLTLVETAAERIFDDAELEFARGFGEQAAMALHNARLFENVKRLHLANLRALSSALTAKDFYTVGHTARVAAYAVLLADELGWGLRETQQLEEVSYLHDVGKITVADRVLLKSGTLTEEEWVHMRQHPLVSAEIIEALFDDDLVAGVRHHHERYDGTGYPDGLAGEAIPLVARILCLVDAYDAMSSRRVYGRALTYEECLMELWRCSGSHFDPALVEPFSRVLRRLAAERQVLQVAAEEAAATIDAADHLALLRSEDEAGPEYARVRAALLRTRSAHAEVGELHTEAPEGELRRRVIVHSDTGEETRVPLGSVSFADDLELETFAGRRYVGNVVTVNELGARISAAAPLRAADGSVVGLVCAYRQPPHGQPASLLKGAVTTAFSEIVRTAAARQTRAEIESMTDPLTGLYNHRRFQECLREEVEASRTGTLALLFCDIDHFKLLNDTHGHLEGDDVLRRVGRILVSSVRRGDVAARYGGDEFCVLLRDADMETALEVADRIRVRVAALDVPAGGVGPTVSIGVATLPDGGNAEELLTEADRAMYAAKELGRDRVVRADTSQELPPDLPSML